MQKTCEQSIGSGERMCQGRERKIGGNASSTADTQHVDVISREERESLADIY